MLIFKWATIVFNGDLVQNWVQPPQGYNHSYLFIIIILKLLFFIGLSSFLMNITINFTYIVFLYYTKCPVGTSGVAHFNEVAKAWW